MDKARNADREQERVSFKMLVMSGFPEKVTFE